MTAVAQDVSTLAGARTLPFLAGVEERLAAQLADDSGRRAPRARRWPRAASACGRCSC